MTDTQQPGNAYHCIKCAKPINRGTAITIQLCDECRNEQPGNDSGQEARYKIAYHFEAGYFVQDNGRPMNTIGDCEYFVQAIQEVAALRSQVEQLTKENDTVKRLKNSAAG